MKNQKFADSISLFRCPICQKSFDTDLSSLVCENNHRFDIAAKGYVNLAPSKGSSHYDKVFFENRKIFMDKGFYEHVLEKIQEQVHNYINSGDGKITILDAGCGEGYYARALQQEDTQIFGLDLSKEALQIASRGNNHIRWLVGDINQIPLQNHAMDMILNIFTPGSYQEFLRILKPDGLVLKVIPGPGHLKELRSLLGKTQEEDKNQLVKDHFEQSFEILDEMYSCKTYDLHPEDIPQLLAMTPLAFGEAYQDMDFSQLKEITIDAHLLVGRSE